jgi:hypothetical protein
LTPQVSKIEQKEIRNDIMDFEAILKQHPGSFIGDTDNCPLKHSFSDGIYVREIKIPAGTLLTGKIHKHSHPNFLMEGEVTVYTESGGLEGLMAPASMISNAGTKRVVMAVTDVVWITVHHNPTNTQDLKELEEIIIADSYEKYDKFIASKNSFWVKIGTFVKTILKIN